MKAKLLMLFAAFAVVNAAVPSQRQIKEVETKETPPAVEHPNNNCKWRTGDECTKEDCERCGYCRDMRSYFYRCERVIPEDPKDEIVGVIVHEECDHNLWWNPDIKPVDAENGGTCTPWANLSSTVQAEYKADPLCVEEICVWDQDHKCSNEYYFYDPKVHDREKGERDNFSCPAELIWDPASETCGRCERVKDCCEIIEKRKHKK